LQMNVKNRAHHPQKRISLPDKSMAKTKWYVQDEVVPNEELVKGKVPANRIAVGPP
jgi:hypothetical protein